MELGRLDHVNVRTANLENMVSWYGRMLGMKSGDRPNFPFPGAWMYVGDQAVVHLIGVAGDDAEERDRDRHQRGCADHLSCGGGEHRISHWESLARRRRAALAWRGARPAAPLGNSPCGEC